MQNNQDKTQNNDQLQDNDLGQNLLRKDFASPVLSSYKPIVIEEDLALQEKIINASNQERESQDSPTTQKSHKKGEYILYPQRYAMLVFFSLIQITTSSLVSTCSPIADYLQFSYGCSNFLINFATQIYLLMHPLFTFPASMVIDKYGTYVGILIGCSFLIAGVWIRYLINYSFAFVIVGQLLSGIGRPLIMNSQGKVASAWFPVEKRAFITSILSFLNTGSIVLGILYPGIVFKDYNKDEGQQKGKDYAETLMLNEAIMATAFSIPAMLFYRNTPPTPPSKTAGMLRMPTGEAFKQITHNRNYILLIIACGFQLGTFNAMGALCNYLISPFGYKPLEISIIGACPIISGIVSVILVAPILKKYLCFKLLITICLIGAFIMAGVGYFLFNSGYYYAILSQLLSGIFMISATPIILELGVELTFPAGEQLSVGLLFAYSQLCGVILSFVLGFYVKGQSKWQSYEGLITISGFFFIAGLIIQFVNEDLRRMKAELNNVKQSLRQSEIQKALEKSQKQFVADFTKEEKDDIDKKVEEQVKLYISQGQMNNQILHISQKLSIV